MAASVAVNQLSSANKLGRSISVSNFSKRNISTDGGGDSRSTLRISPVEGEPQIDKMDDARGKLVLSHKGRAGVAWHTAVLGAAAASMFIMPLRIGFLKGDSRHALIEIIGLCLDVVFIVDLLLHFFWDVYDDVTTGRLVHSHREIVQRYVKSDGFWLDVIGAMPYSRIHPGLWNVDYLHVTRFHRLLRKYSDWSKDTNTSFALLSLGRCLVVLFLAIHLAASVFFVLARDHDFADGTWVGTHAPHLPDSTLLHKYMLSMYYATTTITTVGYGDISPESNAEMGFSCVFMIVNILISAFIIGNVTIIVTKADLEVSQFHDEAAFIQRFCRTREIPSQLCQSMISFLEYQYSQRGSKQLLGSFPSSIQNRLRTALHEESLGSVMAFEGCSLFFRNTIIAICEEEPFMEGMSIVSAHDVLKEVYMLTSGFVELTVPVPEAHGGGEVVAATLGPGLIVGGEAFFCQKLQPFTVRVAKGGAKAIKINEKDRRELALSHPTDYSTILLNMRKINSQLIREIADRLGDHAEEVFGASTLKGRWAAVQREVFGGSNPNGTAEIEKDQTQESDYEQKIKSRLHGIVHNIRRASTSMNMRRVGTYREKEIDPGMCARHTAGLSQLVKLLYTTQQNLKSAHDLFAQDMAGRMCTCAAKGNELELEAMLQTAPTPDLGDYDGRCAIHLAAAKGQVEVLRTLINHNANVNVKDAFGTTPLLEAVQAGEDECLDLLMSVGATLDMRNPGEAMCTAASSSANVVFLRRLLRAGIPPDSADYDRRTGLHLSAAEGALETVKALVEGKATIGFKDRWGVDALTEAVKHKQIDVAEFLLASGADPNATDDLNHTVLHHAVMSSEDCIAPLVKAGGHLGDQSGVAELMCRAASRDDSELLGKLLRAGASPDACDYDRRTALHLSAAEGKLRSVVLLVEGGATVGFKDRWGHAALDEALSNGDADDVVRFLQNAAAKRINPTAASTTTVVEEF